MATMHNTSYLLCTCHVPGPFGGTSHASSSLSFRLTLWRGSAIGSILQMKQPSHREAKQLSKVAEPVSDLESDPPRRVV